MYMLEWESRGLVEGLWWGVIGVVMLWGPHEVGMVLHKGCIVRVSDRVGL